MSTNSSSRRCTRRSARDLDREKMNPNVDLNSPPAEAQSSRHPPRDAPTIDLEASDDEIQLLTSPRGFPQVRNQSRRRNRSVIVVVDEERDTASTISGVPVGESLYVPSRFRQNKRQRFPPSRAVINCESYSSSILEDGPACKKKKASTPPPPPVKVTPKESTFSCPICMGTLVSPCSTKCGHIFCEGCIKTAILVKKQCPTCRTQLGARNNFHRVFLPTTTN